MVRVVTWSNVARAGLGKSKRTRLLVEPNTTQRIASGKREESAARTMSLLFHTALM